MLNKYLRLNLHFLSPLVLVLMLFKYINMYENKTQNKKKKEQAYMPPMVQNSGLSSL